MRNFLEKLFPKRSQHTEKNNAIDIELQKQREARLFEILEDVSVKKDIELNLSRPKKHTDASQQNINTSINTSTEEPTNVDDKMETDWIERKNSILEKMLGKPLQIHYFALIPYEIGGMLDLYFYPDSPYNTAIVTKQLSHATKPSISNANYQKYELAMYTKLDAKTALDMKTKEMSDLANILNIFARHLSRSPINSGDTIEFPNDGGDMAGRCFVMKAMTGGPDNAFGLMTPIEIFHSEMLYAREFGSAELIEKLYKTNHFPYSDMTRDPVV